MDVALASALNVIRDSFTQIYSAQLGSYYIYRQAEIHLETGRLGETERPRQTGGDT